MHPTILQLHRGSGDDNLGQTLLRLARLAEAAHLNAAAAALRTPAAAPVAPQAPPKEAKA